MTAPKETPNELWFKYRTDEDGDVIGHSLIFHEDDEYQGYLSSTHARSPEHLKTLSDSEIAAAGFVRKNPQSRVPFDAYIDQLDDNK
jgi:hypothetical protein